MRTRILGILTLAEDYVSGQQLAAQLGITRAAVWKHIQVLKTAGYHIEAQPNRGYVLRDKANDITAEAVTQLIKGPIGSSFHHFPSISSTNMVAKDGAVHGAAHGTVYMAEQQTHGRGRQGRHWSSVVGGLWFSVVLRPQIPLHQVHLMTVLTAVALCDSLRRITRLPGVIKWPNDILLNNKKVAGILTELTAEQDVVDFCVVGIGLNVNIDDSLWDVGVREIATSLQMVSGKKLDRLLLLVAICDTMSMWLEKVKLEGWRPLIQAWRQYDITLGRPVTVLPAGKNTSYDGFAVDVDDKGALLVRCLDGSIQNVLAGDVSLRIKQ